MADLLPAFGGYGAFSLPPLVVSQDISQTFPLWSGDVPSTWKLSPPTSPGTVEPAFSASTSELDKYRALFLVLGIIIGALVLRR